MFKGLKKELGKTTVDTSPVRDFFANTRWRLWIIAAWFLVVGSWIPTLIPTDHGGMSDGMFAIDLVLHAFGLGLIVMLFFTTGQESDTDDEDRSFM